MATHKTNAELIDKLNSKSNEDVLYQIEQAKQEWETTVDSLPQLVCLLDNQKQVIRANRTVESWNLASVVEVKGKNIHSLLHPNCHTPTCYLQTFLNNTWPTLVQNQVIAEYEFKDPLLNRYLHIQLRPISPPFKPSPSRNLSFATLIIQDITQRKQLEEDLQKANEELEQRVEKRTAQLKRVALENSRLYETQREQFHRLQQSQEELIRIEKMAALGRLVASIAHEINNPLQSIQGFLDLSREALNSDDLHNKLHKYLNIADNEIGRISAIVRRMRDFYSSANPSQSSQPESLDEFYRSTTTDLQIINLNETLENVLLLTNKKLEHSHIKVKTVWADTLPQIKANPDHFKQVFLNLTLNAIDAMQKNGGTLCISTAFHQAILNNQQPQPVVQIEFADTGPGVPAELLPRLFDPLFTTKEHGSGFGLYTSREIVEAHQGRITATSVLGKGTTFTIVLPVE